MTSGTEMMMARGARAARSWLDLPDPVPLGLALGFALERLRWDEAEAAQEGFLSVLDAEIRRLRRRDAPLSHEVFHPITEEQPPAPYLKKPRTNFR
jgi:hypothetical protein